MSKIDIDDLKKTSAEMAGNLTNKPSGFDNIEEVVNIEEGVSSSIVAPKQPVRRVNFKKVPVESNVSPSSVTLSKEVSTADFFTIGSLNIPKPTLFLAVILLAVGIALWFMTNKSTNKQPDRRQPHQE
jgi:hypothetical protein